jgi:hypothetical protein
MPVYVGRFGNSVEEVFVCAGELKERLGKDFDKVPAGAIGVYSYHQRLAQGMKQLMAGSRKFTLDHITRDDIVPITEEAARISGLPYVMDYDKEEAERILNS